MLNVTASDMYKNRNGKRNNISGIAIKEMRLASSPALSQRALAERMQLVGLDMDKNAIQRIESGARFVTDIELAAFARIFEVPVSNLLKKSRT